MTAPPSYQEARAVLARLWRHTKVCGECRVWVGALAGGEPGPAYGYMKWRGQVVGVHRIAFLVYVGEIPEGHDVHHVCENKRCWAPEHLQAVPATRNRTLAARKRQHR